MVSQATPLLCDPSSSILTRSRTPSGIDSSSDLNSSNSTILGFDSQTLSLADRCLNKPSFSTQGGLTHTTVTSTHPSTLPSAPLLIRVSPPPCFQSRIPRPIPAIPRAMSPRPRILTQTPQMVSSAPLYHSRPHFEAISQIEYPPPSRSPACDPSAQTRNAELTLQKRFPGVIIPPIYHRPSQQSSQSTHCDTRSRQKPKKASYFINSLWK